jgi:3-phosphoshikimate 1-carboxyvinyltransferase
MIGSPSWPDLHLPDVPGEGWTGASGPEERSFVVEPGGPLVGRLRVPGDKSVSHRALMLGARANGVSTIRGLSDGDDVRRTALAMTALGATIEFTEAGSAGLAASAADSHAAGDRGEAGRLALPGVPEIHITGGSSQLHEADLPLDLGNSGTAIRLLSGWVASFPWLTVLHGDESIARRPMDRVLTPLRRMGATVDARAGGSLPPVVIRGGRLSGIDYRLPVASAQVKAAVLLAGTGATSPTIVREPIPLRAHTEEMLAACGADITVSDGGSTVEIRPSVLRPFALTVPGDPSQAAFWVVAACIVPGSDLTIEGVYVGRARAGFLDVLRRMGADLTVTMLDATTADIRARSAPLRGTTVGGAEIPGLIDEIPVLAVAAAVAEGPSRFSDAAEMRVKETDRIATVCAGLSALGAGVEPLADGLALTGGARLVGAPVSSYGDHRVAMAMAVAALVADGPTTVGGWDAVATSYPAFADNLAEIR